MAISLTTGPGFPEEVLELLKLARNTANNAYNPYSARIAGASVQTLGGIRFAGTSMQNVSFGLTICAEPAALLAANSAGYRDILRIAVVGGDPESNEIQDPCIPCGGCRQIVWEAAKAYDREIEVYCSELSLTRVLLTTSDELLPYA